MKNSLTTFALIAFGLLVLYVSSKRLFSPLETRHYVSALSVEKHTPEHDKLPWNSQQVLGLEATDDLLRDPRRRRFAESWVNSNFSFKGFGGAHPQSQMGEVPYIVMGIATSPKNSGHRSWIRRTWCRVPTSNQPMSTKPHIQTQAQQNTALLVSTRMSLPNVQRSVHAVFLIGLLTSEGVAHARSVRAALRDEQATYGDLLWLHARETKPPGTTTNLEALALCLRLVGDLPVQSTAATVE